MILHARFVALTALILAAAASRLVPHPPNFTPIAAMALFGGAHFSDRRVALLVPLSAMLLSDLVLGLHGLIPVVYACFAITVVIGFRLRWHRAALPVATAALASSTLFFLVTNLAVWAFGSVYPKTWAGLVACYVAAVPFFGNTLAGDAVYTAALFGAFALAEKRLPALRAPGFSRVG
ncbi:MAG: DUF6580 family putative transport protein [Candidatus Binatia bacterium]